MDFAAPWLDIDEAAARLREGAVLAYPTEAVWGLGCDPANEAAVLRLLHMKQRSIDKGLILVAADASQLETWLDWSALSAAQCRAVHADWPGPHTWVVPARPDTPRWITGQHASLAVRVSDHPVVVALCRSFGGTLVSTSANATGQPPARSEAQLDPGLLAQVDGIVRGRTGTLARPTSIRDARSGDALRI